MTALSQATRDLFSKKGLQHMNEYVMAWGLRAFALPFVLPLLLFAPIPQLDAVFWQALVAGSCLNVVASIMYMRAIKLSPLSVTVPMITFTPLLMLITSPLILGEFPALTGILGIVFIVSGAYVIHVRGLREGPLEPFRRLAKEQGPLWMLGVAFIWSITSNIDKVAVNHSNPLFYIVAFNILMFVLITPIAYLKAGGSLGRTSRNLKYLLLVGIFATLIHVFQMSALPLTLAAYVISVKRLSAAFAVIYGLIFFREKNIMQALAGTCIMLIGVFLITLF